MKKQNKHHKKEHSKTQQGKQNGKKLSKKDLAALSAGLTVLDNSMRDFRSTLNN